MVTALEADSHKLHMTCAAVAEVSSDEKLKNSYLCRNATVCLSRMCQIQFV